MEQGIEQRGGGQVHQLPQYPVPPSCPGQQERRMAVRKGRVAVQQDRCPSVEQRHGRVSQEEREDPGGNLHVQVSADRRPAGEGIAVEDDRNQEQHADPGIRPPFPEVHPGAEQDAFDVIHEAASSPCGILRLCRRGHTAQGR